MTLPSIQPQEALARPPSKRLAQSRLVGQSRQRYAKFLARSVNEPAPGRFDRLPAPPASRTIAGVPQANASTMLKPKVSGANEGKISAVASWYTGTSSACGMGPRKRIFDSRRTVAPACRATPHLRSRAGHRPANRRTLQAIARCLSMRSVDRQTGNEVERVAAYDRIVALLPRTTAGHG